MHRTAAAGADAGWSRVPRRAERGSQGARGRYGGEPGRRRPTREQRVSRGWEAAAAECRCGSCRRCCCCRPTLRSRGGGSQPRDPETAGRVRAPNPRPLSFPRPGGTPPPPPGAQPADASPAAAAATGAGWPPGGGSGAANNGRARPRAGGEEGRQAGPGARAGGGGAERLRSRGRAARARAGAAGAQGRRGAGSPRGGSRRRPSGVSSQECLPMLERSAKCPWPEGK